MFSAASVCLFVCVFVCEQDNCRTSKHRMMKLGDRCTVQKSRPSSNSGVIPHLGAHPPKCDVGYHVGKNQSRLSVAPCARN